MKQEFRDFLINYFNGLRLRKPLFYNWQNSLRFDLQVGSTTDKEYFKTVLERSKTIFESVFEKSDEVIVVLTDYKYRKQKIRFGNYVFKQIENLKPEEITYTKFRRLYEINDKKDIRNVALLKTTTKRVNYKNILTAIGNSDFNRKPSLDKLGFLTNKKVYFLNLNKKIIFHMYDDRGFDVIASYKENLKSIYLKYNAWILDYDRKEIDEKFDN